LKFWVICEGLGQSITDLDGSEKSSISAVMLCPYTGYWTVKM
jgi:hypothetical protein